jgi:hypothetical protein
MPASVYNWAGAKLTMATLIFDIETSALPLDRLDEAQQEYLFRECGRIVDEAGRERAAPKFSGSAVSGPSQPKSFASPC